MNFYTPSLISPGSIFFRNCSFPTVLAICFFLHLAYRLFSTKILCANAHHHWAKEGSEYMVIPLRLVHSHPNIEGQLNFLEKNHRQIWEEQAFGHINTSDLLNVGTVFFSQETPKKRKNRRRIIRTKYTTLTPSTASTSSTSEIEGKENGHAIGPHTSGHYTDSNIDEIIPVVNRPRSVFVGPLMIGTPSQTLWLVFDTGSTETLVVSSLCRSPTCQDVKVYDPKKSRTSEILRPRKKYISKFPCGVIKWIFGRDRLQLGHYVFENQIFSLITDEMGNKEYYTNAFRHIDFQGILGLGLSTSPKAEKSTFFEKIFSVLPPHIPKQFSLYTIDDEFAPFHTYQDGLYQFASALIIGYPDPAFYSGSISYVPVTHNHYWEVALHELWVGNTKLCCDDHSGSVIIDSGTSHNSMTSSKLSEFLSILHKIMTSSNGKNLNSYPTLRYKLDSDVELVYTPEMYMVQVPRRIPRPIYRAIDLAGGSSQRFILGTHVHFRNYLTTFRRISNINDVPMVGFAKASHTKENARRLKALGEKYLSYKKI